MNKFILIFILFVLSSAGCTKLTTPTAGNYRATIEIGGGTIPFELKVETKDGTPHLWLLQNSEAFAATDLRIKDHRLLATLPNGAGQLNAAIGQNSLEGELQLTDPRGEVHQFPFRASLDSPYRFVAESSTDNADVSGYWQLSTSRTDPLSTPITLQLTQSFDAIDGKQITASSATPQYIYGQAHGDDIYLSALSAGQAWLFISHVNSQGNLEGKLWINSSDSLAAEAIPMKEGIPELENQDELRQVGLPWAVPTR